MNCKSVQNQLSAYIDREIAGSEQFEIRAHLMACDACQAEETSLRTLKRLLSTSPVPEPPADFADRLCASVLAHHRPEFENKGRITLRKSVITFVGVAACSMTLTFLILSNVHPSKAAGESHLAVGKGDQDLAFAVQRDQVYGDGLDVTSGVPVISTPKDVRP